MKCPSCYAQQSDDASFCGHCGTLLKAPFTTEQITATASAPDGDNDTVLSCELIAEYHGVLPVPVTRFRLNVFYKDDIDEVEHSIKSASSLTAQNEDLEAGDTINLSVGGYCRLPKGGLIENLSIKPQLILYPVKWHEPISHELSDEPISETVSMSKEGLRVIAWSLFPNEINQDTADYNLRVHFKNESLSAISMIAVRTKVLSRKNKEFYVTTSWIENLGPQEDIIEEFYLEVSKDVRTRSGAIFEIQFGECIRPIVANVDEPEIEFLSPELSDNDDDANDSDDGDTRYDDNTEEYSDTEKVEVSSYRKAKFTFSNVRNFELDANQAKAVSSIFGLQSVAQLEKCDLKSLRNEYTEESYVGIEKIILPHISAEVFFHNFSNANAIFADPEEINFTANVVDGDKVVSCKLIHCRVKKGNNSGGKRLEIGVETEVIFDVVRGVDVENPETCDDDDLQDQFRECRNMFNFSIDGFEYDDDEVLDHPWQASFVSLGRDLIDEPSDQNNKNRSLAFNSRQVLTFGIIPKDWSGSQNDDQRISVGDPETSQTREFDIELLEDESHNLELIGLGDSRAFNSDELWDGNSEFFKQLAEKALVEFRVKIMPKLLQQLWALFQDELEDNVSKFVVVAEGGDGAEFSNDSGKYNGCVYVRFYFEDEHDEISREKVIVIR